jgi:hypothetical protein
MARTDMEYVRDRGLLVDLPFDTMIRTFTETYTAASDTSERDTAFDP